MTPLETAQARVRAAWEMWQTCRRRAHRLRNTELLEGARLEVWHAQRAYREAVEECDAIAERATETLEAAHA